MCLDTYIFTLKTSSAASTRAPDPAGGPSQANLRGHALRATTHPTSKQQEQKMAGPSARGKRREAAISACKAAWSDCALKCSLISRFSLSNFVLGDFCCDFCWLAWGYLVSFFNVRPRCQIRPTTHAYPAYVFSSTATNGLTKEAVCFLLNMSGVYGGGGGGGR